MLITPHKPGLESARLLRDAIRSIGLPAKIRSRAKYAKASRAPVINWGNSRAGGNRIVNRPEAVRIAIDKLATLSRLSEAEIPCPEYTTDPEYARQWDRAISRFSLRGSSGRGIVAGVAPGAPLYCRFYPKRAEFRAHVIGTQVVRVQRKRRKNGADRSDIWSHSAGYVYSCRLGDIPEGLEAAAIGAVRALGLDFGAVDAIDYQGRAIVLEVNTAPGLSPSTAEIYARELLQLDKLKTDY